MLLLLLCVIVNALLSVIFKFFDKFHIDNKAAIAVNYIVCVITGLVIFRHYEFFTSLWNQDWLWFAAILGFLFVFTFNMVAITVQQHGLVVATVFQRLSMIAPALIAILIYGESSNFGKWLGIMVAFTSVILLSMPAKGHQVEANIKSPVRLWIFPIIVFLGSCLIDSGLYFLNHHQVIMPDDVSFICALFLFAGIFGFVQLLLSSRKMKHNLTKKNILGGIALGIPNFFSIFLLLKVLNSGLEASLIFPTNNVGILMASAIFGVILFGEQIKGRQFAGFLSAILSIILISNG